jgi:hypothetical protein
MTLGEAIEECGMEPAEVGYDDEEEYQEMEPAESGIPAMLKFISGFYNKDADAPLNEGNFTIGGTRMKIKVKKAWEDGEFGDCPQEDVIKIFKFIDSKDPSHGTADFEGAGHDRNEEQSHILRLAGVAKPEMEVAEQLPSNPGTGPSWDVSNIENAMKNIKLKFGDEEIDMAHPDPAQLQRIGGGMMQKGIQQVPNQNVQFPGGQMNPQDMMKAIMQKINFGN